MGTGNGEHADPRRRNRGDGKEPNNERSRLPEQEFTRAQPQTIPAIAVVEEAQAVLVSGGSSGEGPYVSWVKEGRKYDLGAVLITQQPGSISSEILSQGDNWFCFHLLSAGDLKAIKSANAHFSDDNLVLARK